MPPHRILASIVKLQRHQAASPWSGGPAGTRFDSTMVNVEPDAGLVGYGGECPLIPFHLPAPAAAVEADQPELGPRLPGQGIAPEMDVHGNPAVVE
jgi:hypothetical protein